MSFFNAYNNHTKACWYICQYPCHPCLVCMTACVCVCVCLEARPVEMCFGLLGFGDEILARWFAAQGYRDCSQSSMQTRGPYYGPSIWTPYSIPTVYQTQTTGPYCKPQQQKNTPGSHNTGPCCGPQTPSLGPYGISHHRRF